MRYVDAVVLTGGSAYGLAAADGVMGWLEQHDRGVAMEGGLVPIVPSAVIFDLPVGGWQCRPTAEFGFAAAEAAGVDVPVGTVGAGVGARAGVLKGGLGTASITLDDIGVTVGAIVAVNCRGQRRSIRPPGCRGMADQIAEFGLVAPPADEIAAFAERDAELSPAEHHDRRRRHRRRTEPGRLPAGGDRGTGRPGPHHPPVLTPRWTAIPCSRWPPAPSRCRRIRETPGRRCRRRCR